MTTFTLSPTMLCLAGGTLLAATGLVTQTDAHERHADDAQDLRCEVITHNLGGSVEISGKVTSQTPVRGSYALSIRQANEAGHAIIDQSGEFRAGKGRTTTLVQAVLSGSSQTYRAELSLVVDGQHLLCRNATHHTDI